MAAFVSYSSVVNLISVIIRSYIAGMRDQLKEYKAKVEHGEHAHYHGTELCTSDHGKTDRADNI